MTQVQPPTPGLPAARPTVVVVGLGPAGTDLLTVATLEAIEAHPVRFVRTVRHPSASVVVGAESFDHVYDTADTMDEVYRTIAERLVDAARLHGTVVYAVPGSPVVAEHTVELLVADASVSVDLVPALSFVDLAWVRLGIDPVAVGARIVDGHRFDVEAAGTTGALLVAQCDRPEVLESVKLAVGEALESAGIADADAPNLMVLQQLGGRGEQVLSVPWFALDRIHPDHLTSVWIPPLAATVSGEMAQLAALVATLRQQCPWDREQSHGSLRPHLLEEAHEVLEALDALAVIGQADAGLADDADPPPGDPYGHLAEELGDLLFQIVFHATLAAEQGQFTLADVVIGIHDKLRDRHPHVFGDPVSGDPVSGDAGVSSGADLAGSWEQAKKAEKGRDSVFDGIPVGLPALARAAKVLRKASAIGGTAAGGLPSVALPNVSVRATSGVVGEVAIDIDTDIDIDIDTDIDTDTDREVEVGAMLLAVVALAGQHGVDPESALRRVSARYEAEMRALEADPG